MDKGALEKIENLTAECDRYREALEQFTDAACIAIDVLDREAGQRRDCEDDPDNPTKEYTLEPIAASNALAEARDIACAALNNGEEG